MAHKNVATSIHQGLLVDQLKKLFPCDELHQNARKETNLKYNSSGSFVELDIYIPSLLICFEFQDSYHYIPTWYNQNSKEYIASQDKMKQTIVQQSGLTLVEVPCWWDGQLESLATSIRFQRPDLLSDFYPFQKNKKEYSPISFNPYFGFFPYAIPDVGELMLASFPADPQFNKNMINDSWWMGEKYDGVRVCWHPQRQTIYGRSGREFLLPTQFSDHMPEIFVDAELWFGRGRFANIYMLVNGAPESVQWHLLKLLAFDVPSMEKRQYTFEERYEHLLDHLERANPFVTIAARVKCKDSKHLKRWVESLIDHHGEGLVLRLKLSLYVPGRSPFLIKLKTSYGDTEAMVVAIGANKSIKLNLPNGNQLVVPGYNVNIPTPKIGTIVTVTYDKHYLKDVPLNPKIYRIRHDLSWQDVLFSSKQDKKYLSGSSFAVSFNIHPLDQQMTSRMRLYLENFAKKNNMDHLQPHTWHTLAYEAINQFQSGRGILQRFNGSYYKTIHYLFPDVALDPKAFPEVENRRKFFEDYAEKHKFNPRNPDNWYLQSRKTIMKSEGAQRVLFFHDRSISKALIELFPDIGLQRSKFPSLPMWRNPKNRKRFFEEYAKENGFDPHIPENWYSQPKHKIEEKKGAVRVLFYHDNNISKALKDLFPDIGLIISKFSTPPRWSEITNRRNFFIQFAKNNNFDPLNSNEWYLQSRDKIMSTKGAAGVVLYHKYNLAQTLVDLFPNIGLEKDKLDKQWDIKYQNRIEKQKFFEEYANDNGFDPLIPGNWYLQNKRNFSLLKRDKKIMFHKILFFYNHDLPKAIMDLFPDIGLDVSKFKHL